MGASGQVDIEVQEPIKSAPWGSRLREMRLSRDLSIEDVSSETHLEKKVIENIEAEAAEQLPTASFVRGYLRSYAKFLDVDHGPIVAAFSERYGDNEPALKTLTQVKELSSSDAAPRYTTWIVVAVLLLSAGAWWWTKVLVPSAVDVVNRSEIAETMLKMSENDTQMEGRQSLVEEEAADAMAPADESESIVETAAPLVDESVGSTLVMSFDEDSWVEIRDADGKSLFMDLAKAGETRTMSGKSPFNVLLGNAPGVKLEYNGEPFDNSRYNRKGVARFKVGE
jgi:cytoskeleton protein RodZ